MEISYKAELFPLTHTKVQISYLDLMYASENLTPTAFRVYLYIIGHPDKIVTREELIAKLGVDSGHLYKIRCEMTQLGIGSALNGLYTVCNTIWGEDKEYVPNW